MATRFMTILMTAAILLVGAAVAQPDEIDWMSYENGLALGKQESKTSYVFFQADWCAVCHRMEKDTLQHRQVVAYLSDHFVAIKVDVDQNRPLADRYGAGKLPHSVFLSDQGEVIAHRPAYIPPELFMKILKAVVAAEAQK